MKWTKPTPRRRRRFAAWHRVLSRTRINGQVWPDAAGNEAKLTGRALHAASGTVGFSVSTASIGEVNLHYRIGGTGSPVVLIHGYAETGHMWGPVMSDLATTHTVIVPDLRGAGSSDKPATGYDKKTLAQD